MDIRIEKTERAIRNAFLELRAAKPLEKITVKELCSLACINKSTFYSHYEDIYALSQMLESETITTVIKIFPVSRNHRLKIRMRSQEIYIWLWYRIIH